jgi:NAD/NADP transhydrogenase beta subunit
MESAFTQYFWQFAYLFAAFATVFAIKWLNHPSTARRGVIIGEIGFALAIIGTFFRSEVKPEHYVGLQVDRHCPRAGFDHRRPRWRVWCKMTCGPAVRTALSRTRSEPLAAALVGTAEYLSRIPRGPNVPRFHDDGPFHGSDPRLADLHRRA